MNYSTSVLGNFHKELIAQPCPNVLSLQVQCTTCSPSKVHCYMYYTEKKTRKKPQQLLGTSPLNHSNSLLINCLAER